jgi:hypothetical protein
MASQPPEQPKNDESVELKEVSMSQSLSVDDEYVDNDDGVRIKGFTRRDRNDMRRMGKRQEFMRNFRPLSTLSFTVIIQASWEFILM